jgi:5'-nucleotidase
MFFKIKLQETCSKWLRKEREVNNSMRFLITSSSGIFSPAVGAIVEVLNHFGEVFVVCPHKESSLAGYTVTLHKPLKVTELTAFGAEIKSWVVNGTSVDCVKIGIEKLIKKKIDFIVSGIHIGSPSGRDLAYCGDIAAAMEGTFFQIPSLALSIDGIAENEVNFSSFKKYFNELIEVFLAHKHPKGVCFHIHFPALTEKNCQGVKVVDFDFTFSRYKYVTIHDDHQDFYVLQQKESERKDKETRENNSTRASYITVTPLENLISQRKHIRKLERWFKDK